MVDLPVYTHAWERSKEAGTRQELLAMLGEADTTPIGRALFESISNGLLAFVRGERSEPNHNLSFFDMIPYAIREDMSPAELKQLRDDGFSPVFAAGRCLAPEAFDGDIMFSRPGESIRPGDIVTVAVAGVMSLTTKVFLATTKRTGRDEALFYARDPEAVWAVPIADLKHVEKVVHIKRRLHPLRLSDGGELIGRAHPVVRELMAIHTDMEMPVERTLSAGWERALEVIVARLRELPDEVGEKNKLSLAALPGS